MFHGRQPRQIEFCTLLVLKYWEEISSGLGDHVVQYSFYIEI
jgi:hypothetical protein